MKKKDITIFSIGDKADYDSYKKFHREKTTILENGFEYASASYRKFLAKGAPRINTKKVIIFLFFPFAYWNTYIEHRNYKGLYGNHIFHKKFTAFWKKVHETVKSTLWQKKVFFINPPFLCGLYRDKKELAEKFSREKIPIPGRVRVSRAKDLIDLLDRGRSFFVKPRYGSMGKGITFLSWANWQTNFIFKRGKIANKPSDRGWRFRDITGNKKFLGELLKKDFLTENAIESLLFKKMKVDMRIYTFFNRVLYVYPRRNKPDRITTNISQGAKGDPDLLKKLPGNLLKKAEKLAVKISKLLGVNSAGMDIMMDRNLKDVYVIDVNIFPGFPKRKTFNIAKAMIASLEGLVGENRVHFSKINDI